MLLDWLVKLKRSNVLLNVLLQIVYFQKVFNVSDTEYFMYLSMSRQFNVYNFVEEPGRMYLPGTLELLTFISKLLVFMGHTVNHRLSPHSRTSPLLNKPPPLNPNLRNKPPLPNNPP